MEVRCGKCDKLFRVPDEKISGKGIKFACTRCSTIVIITREDVEQYNLARSSMTSAAEAQGPETSAEQQQSSDTEPRVAEEDLSAASKSETPSTSDTNTDGSSTIESKVRQEHRVMPTFSEDILAPDVGKLEMHAETQATEHAHAAKAERIEVRCGKCDKRFIVPLDKISGSGVKFPCTRCGEYLNITKEEAERSSHVATASPENGVFQPKTESEADGAHALDLEQMHTEKAVSTESSGPDVFAASFQEPQDPSMREATRSVDAAQTTEQAQSPEPEFLSELVRALETELQKESKPGPVEPHPPTVPPSAQGIMSGQALAAKTAPPPSQTSVPTPERPMPVPVQQKEAIRSVPMPAIESRREASRFRSNKMLLAYVAALIVVCIGAYGLVMHFRSNSNRAQDAAETVTTEGLRVASVVGSIEPNGDLLIAGTIENIADREKSDWFLVVDVYNAQGQELNKIRLLNGKQLYTTRDYEILSSRGANVQELKEKNRDNRGTTIPPRSSVPFEMRYMQPPAGVANFNVTIRPFDPIRLFKEIAEDAK